MSPSEPRPAQGRRRQYHFGKFVLDMESGFLRHGDEEVPLQPRAFEVLTYLVERHGQVVAKAELMDAVWPETAVTDNSLSQCMVQIRRALGDDSQQLIRTIARRGYIFSAAVTTPVVEVRGRSDKAPQESAPVPILVGASARKPFRWRAIAGGAVLVAMLGSTLAVFLSTRTITNKVTYTQIANFTDSAVAPVLSPDGRMVAFLRGESFFTSVDQIYVKMLPNGEPVQLTHDPRPKYAPAFSPDGTQVAFSLVTSKEGWATYIVPSLGGEPRLFLPNASGLTWIDLRRLLFSEVKTGWHMGIVTATDGRSDSRDVYWPENERAMAHFSHVSPDLKWVLLIEMDPVWQPCRLAPMDGSSRGRRVGPAGACTSAGWSPDGKWMYFGVEVQGSHHLWRARFPDGAPERITEGPSEEDGVAVAPDGRSLITSIGMRQSELWLHDSRGEHRLSSEGFVPDYALESEWFGSGPVFSSDGRSIYYLLRRELPESPRALWRTDIDSGESSPMLPGFSIQQYDVSSDGKQVVFSMKSSAEKLQIWLAPLDRSSSPNMIATLAGTAASPYFGPEGEVLFRDAEGGANYLYRMNRDGSGRARLVPYPVSTIQSISPDRRWIVAMVPNTSAIPTTGGEPKPICFEFCPATWSPDGHFLFLVTRKASQQIPGRTVAIPVPRGETLPKLPAPGIRSHLEAAALPGARVIDRADVVPGLNADTFAYVKRSVHRNLFRVALR